MRSSLKAALIAPLVALVFGAVAAGCSLGNISRADCATNDDCVAAFGVGSLCGKDGFCSAPSGCETGHDCRKLIGGGACVNKACVSKIPTDVCFREDEPPEPPDLLDQPLTGPDAPLVIGSIFSLEVDPEGARDKLLTQAVRLAVREINEAGLHGGQKLGVVFCDNGGPNGQAKGEARDALDAHAVDYLAGTLGVPYIVGPRTSADSIQVVNQLKKRSLPTVVISPAATSPALTVIDDRISPTDPQGLFWRTCPSDLLQGQVLAKNVIGADATIARVTVVYIHDAYGDGLSQVFQKEFGIEKTDLVPYDESTPGDAAAVAKLATDADAKNGDAVLLIAHTGELAVEILAAMQGLPIAAKPFFFTDGAKDQSLTNDKLPTAIKDILKNAKGTEPASPAGQDYEVFKTNLLAEFGVNATSVSFLAQSYDATYIGAFGTFMASKDGTKYDGRQVAAGMALLSSGMEVHLNGVNGWTSGKGLLVQDGKIDVEGTSGHLQFDAKTGEAPGRIGVWTISTDFKSYVQGEVFPQD